MVSRLHVAVSTSKGNNFLIKMCCFLCLSLQILLLAEHCMHHVIGDCKGPIQVSDCFENLFLINVVFDG